eukprot:TRINITY_DN1993_c0_g1_i1.p1 TRINITY_DN1993_c0_g1~~TRINITY_DN1993_c0_g1_i1.p1  ORF type:complete len:187 (+),score=53.18 TRINITY_DN1993_c0_g1_i1:51-563(+)
MGKDKKEKKEKKSKKEKRPREEDEPAKKIQKGEEGGETVRIKVPIAVPFSNDHENLTKKVLSIVKYATTGKTMVRGIKDVTKIVRKEKAKKDALVVLAADISPLDVISHMPVLCQDKNVNYIWVPSRTDLGAATLSKRPTSSVIVQGVPSDKADVYQKVVKLVAKMGKKA